MASRLLEDFDSYNQPSFSRDEDVRGSQRVVDDIIAHSETNVTKPSEIFAIAPVVCDPVKQFGLRDMAVCNNFICMALNNLTIARINMTTDSDILTIPIPQHQQNEQIHKVFMDPTGMHIIITMTTGANNWYCHGTWKKMIPLKEMKGLIIESIAWDKQNLDSETTKMILIGTSKGGIHELIIDVPENQFAKCKWKFSRPLYVLADETKVTGLQFERFPTVSPNEPAKFLVLATTPTQIYQFIGGPTFTSVFECQAIPRFRDMPNDRGDSVLRTYSSSPDGIAKRYAWLTGPGISYGELVFASQNPGDEVSDDFQLYFFPEKIHDKNGTPVSLDIIEYHWVVLYKNRIQAINRLNEEIVWEEYFSNDTGAIRGITKDPRVPSSIWIFAEYKIFSLTITEEDRFIWKLYLDRGDFYNATRYCKSLRQNDIVWTRQADYYFSEKKYDSAARIYGKTTKSFEEITLKFIRLNDRDSLKTYLLAKLENLSDTDRTQKTLLCTWLVEIYLNKLNQLKDEHDHIKYELVYTDFKQFLEDNNKSLNEATTYNLISSHGRVEELLLFAKLKGDYELVVSHHVQRREYLKALSVLCEQKNEELLYNFLPVLMNHIPCETVDSLISAGSNLEPRKLIPALMRYDPAHNRPGNVMNQPIRYLEHCVLVLHNRDPTVHNYLISLYARTNNYERILEKFLASDEAVYDKEYALRTCAKENQVSACVIIYSLMEEYEEAVELALQVDLEIAKYNAKKVPNDGDRRKKLWLRIARHVVEKKHDIKEAMAFLRDTDRLLQIEDILPFFPQFTLIDDFKDEICNALEEYNKRIQELKSEMDEATRSADLIRRDIKNLRNKYGFVAQNQVCDICGYPVLTRQFYLFPCLHVYHSDCLAKSMRPHMTEEEQQRISDLENRIQNELPLKTMMESVGENHGDGAMMMTEVDQLKAELDEIVASECLLCGSVMINEVVTPFFDPYDTQLLESWR